MSTESWREADLRDRALGTLVAYIQGEPDRLRAMGEGQGVATSDVLAMSMRVERVVARSYAIGVRPESDPVWMSQAPTRTGRKGTTINQRRQAAAFLAWQARVWIEANRKGSQPALDRWRLAVSALFVEWESLGIRAHARVHAQWKG